MIQQEPEFVKETFTAYSLTENKEWSDDDREYIKMETPQDGKKLFEYVARKVNNCHEIRIVDSGDNIVFKVVRGELIFPLTDNAKPGNRWYPELMTFVNAEDFAHANKRVQEMKAL